MNSRLANAQNTRESRTRTVLTPGMHGWGVKATPWDTFQSNDPRFRRPSAAGVKFEKGRIKAKENPAIQLMDNQVMAKVNQVKRAKIREIML